LLGESVRAAMFAGPAHGGNAHSVSG